MELDYITATSPSPLNMVEVPGAAMEVKDVAFSFAGAEWAGRQYTGTDGTMTRLTHPDRGTMYQVSGALADRVWTWFPVGEYRWSRTDIKTDVGGDIDLLYWYTRQQQEYPRMSASIINGETLYIGSRKSERFWRVYNKTKQMGMNDSLPAIWRIELELKGERSYQAQSAVFAGQREALFHASAIGVMQDLLESVGLSQDTVGEIDLSLPRKPRAGEKFLHKSVLPFLRRNRWAADVVWRELDDGDM